MTGPVAKTAAQVREWLLAAVAKRINGNPAALDPRERFSRFGIDSMKAAGITAELSAYLGRPLARTLLWDQPSIDAVVRYLTAPAASPSPAPAAAPEVVTPRPGGEPIAIVGVACRFPLAPDPSAYWQLLTEGIDAIREVPGSRWDIERFFSPDLAAPGRMTTRWGGFIDGVDRFDPQFFGISPREAVQMDPQQRIMLELAWEALEDAGIPIERIKGTPTAVFVGAMWSDYARLIAGAASAITQHTATGQDTSIIPARVSYTFGLQGPSVAVNTACSSSLMAVHLACQALRSGEATLALAGGVNLILSPESTVAMSKFGAMAPDGRSKAFDARADGYVRGEGAGLLVLKPLSQAVRDGDAVYCVILGTGVNNDGFSNGLTAPNPQAQEDMLRMAYARAGVAKGDVDYIETHGTGTLLGDPIEAGAIGRALGASRAADRPLLIGSVKTNIGHLEAAAGIAGLIKVALALRNGRIPGNLHFQTPNPNIDFDALHLAVQRRATAWPAGDRPAIAGVSSFGFGGTNCHVVLRQWPRNACELLPLAAPDDDALRNRARELRQQIAAAPEEAALSDLVSTAAAGAVGARRAVLNVRSVADLLSHLDVVIDGREAPGVITSAGVPATPPRLVWVFSPHGGQWAGMGRRLMAEEPVFRATLARCAAAIQREAGWDLFDELFADEAHSKLSDVAVAQPTIFAVQAALAALWRSWGVQPDAVIGHSMGEVAAVHAAGVLTLDDAVRVICQRSRLLARTAGKGALAVVGLSADATAAALGGRGDGLWIVAFNSPASTLVSGESAPLDALLADLERDGVFCRRVRVDVAAHSPHMEPLLEELFAAVRDVRPTRGTARVYSTVEGRVLPGEAFDATYWVRNLRRSVLFAQAVEDVLKDGPAMFLEVGPHPVLAPSLEQYRPIHGDAVSVVESLRRGEDERAALLDALGRMYVAGVVEPCWETVHGGATDVPKQTASRVASTELFVLSAHSRAALGARARDVAGQIRQTRHGSLHDLAYTLSARRVPQPFRLAVTAGDRAQLLDQLEAFAADRPGRGNSTGERSSSGPGRIAFVFPADADVWAGLGRELLQREHAFRTSLERCDALIRNVAGWSLLDELSGSAEQSAWLTQAERVQPALFAMQVALAALWRSWGLEPAAVVGYGIGEAAAAHVAGVISLADAIRIVCRASRASEEMEAQGIALREGGVPVYSGAAGSRMKAFDFTADYWTRSLRRPARDHAALSQLIVEGFDTFIAIGTEPSLFPGLRDLLQSAGRPGIAVSSIRLSESERATLLSAVGALFCYGHDLRWDLLNADGGRVVPLPVYPWQRERYWLDLPAAQATVPAEASDRPRLEDTPERWLYRPVWNPEPLSIATSVTDRPGRWLVLADRGGLGAQLAEDLRRLGQPCVVAYAGTAPRIDAAAVDVADPEAFKRLARGDDVPWRGVVHLWSLDTPDDGDDQIDAAQLMTAQRESCGALVYLVQALFARGHADRPPVWIVTRGAQAVAPGAVVAAGQTPIHGLARSLAQEHSELKCFVVDLDPADREPLRGLASELSRTDGESHVAFRAGSRWTPRLERLQHEPSDTRQVTFDPSGTYLITGGMGALGLRVARWMADRGVRRIVLTGRSASAGQSHPVLGDLRAGGVAVQAVSCDVSRLSDVTALVDSLRRDGAVLKGIVHAAGVLDDGVLLQQNWTRFERVLAPKLAGGWNLHVATRTLPLDFFVLFSSTSALLGASGQSNYAAANAFLDGLAHRRHGLGLNATSVNWGTWAGTGMAARMSDADQRRLSESGMRPMDPEAALSAFALALNAGAPQVGVLSVDWARYVRRYPRPPAFLSALAAEAAAGAASERREPSLAAQLAGIPAERRHAAIAQHVRRHVLLVLGAPPGLPLQNDQGLRDVGLDSLMALELKDRLQASVEQPLPTTLAFDYPTVAAITEYLAREILALAAPGAPTPERAARAAEPSLQGAEQLSDAEAEQLLAEELAMIARAREHEAGA